MRHVRNINVLSCLLRNGYVSGSNHNHHVFFLIVYHVIKIKRPQSRETRFFETVTLAIYY